MPSSIKIIEYDDPPQKERCILSIFKNNTNTFFAHSMGSKADAWHCFCS